MPLGVHARIGLCWIVVIGVGIGSFVLSRRSVDRRRYEDMQVRQRMRNANAGEYETVGHRKFT